MKVLPALQTIEVDPSLTNELILPSGIIGFANHRRAELLYSPEQLPFVWMLLHGPEPLHFLVLEPGGIIPGYEPEIFDEDAIQLGLHEPSDALIINIVTLRKHPSHATVNLIGPIIVNRRTRLGRQRVIANHARYSAMHPLSESPLHAGVVHSA